MLFRKLNCSLDLKGTGSSETRYFDIFRNKKIYQYFDFFSLYIFVPFFIDNDTIQIAISSSFFDSLLENIIFKL